MKRILYSIAFFSFMIPCANVNAQGCVAVRNMSSSCSMSLDTMNRSVWQFSLNYRYFRSYKHFRGDHEETNRVKQGTEVINNDNSVIMGISYMPNKKWSFSVIIPYLFIDRSSLYEHYGNASGNPRFHTQSKGLGDMRLSAYYNLIPSSSSKLTVGLGLKLPTGNYNYKDYFHKKASDGGDSLIYKVVDQSIQPGDGGLGIILEGDYTRRLGNKLALYAYGMYMLNPRNTNGILRSTSTSTIPHGNEFSVSDQFLARLGTQYTFKMFQFGVGARIEGIPARDLIGKNDGFRRPGHIVSAEPSVTFSKGSHLVAFNLPVAIYRNRIRSVYDVQRSAETNTYQHGDAAFADWLLSITYAYRL